MTGDMNAESAAISGLLEQLTRRLHSQGYAARLFPAQWTALRYIHTAPEHLRTAIDLARFQGLASGAVARTVRTLIRKGFIEKHGTIGRGRAERLELTDRGRTLLKRDPMRTITNAIETLEDSQKHVLMSSLRHLVISMGGHVEDVGLTGEDGEAE